MKKPQQIIKFLIACFFIFINGVVYSQEKDCNLTFSEGNNLYSIDALQLGCLAQTTPKNKMLVFTFGIWCGPCRLRLPNAIALVEEYNLEFYVLLIEEENEKELLKNTMDYLKGVKSNINVLVLTDEYHKRRNKKYKNFLDEITPIQFENINDMGKYILFDKSGQVMLVTTWKDNRENDWRDDSPMIEKIIVPLLEK